MKPRVLKSLPSRLRRLTICLLGLAALVLASPSAVHADDSAILSAMIDALVPGKFDERQVAIEALGATGDSRIVTALEALAEGDLYARKADGKAVIATRADGGYALTDPLSGEDLATVSKSAIQKVKVNNRLRRVIRDTLGGLQLRAADPDARMAAAESLFKAADHASVAMLDSALAAETDGEVAAIMRQARAAAVLSGDAGDDDKRAAIETLRERGDSDARSALLAFANAADGPLKVTALDAVGVIESSLAVWSAAQNVWYGLSLGSVLLLAAIGLAITFGVMGVINMAHGEMVMLGAYTTYVIQDAIRASAPGLFEVSLLISIPLAFLVAGGVGVIIERGIIRYLYGRPLETLLATWGISLALQQTVRSIFGPTNQEVATPAFMSGAFELGQMTITYNRLYIIVFAMFVLIAVMLVMKKTAFGLQMRAVTQNRRMAGTMGIRADWIDALTFGLGSGIAGIAGVALSQIDNVSPNLGQSYIIDSFMVVVFGGVGNLWGTLVGALTLGVANKFLEPFAGAVLAKIFVLVFIILFIQKRPRGMFALKGRAVDS